MDDIAIQVKNVSKEFKLPHERHSSIKTAFVNMFRPEKGYDLQPALDDVTFEVRKGDFFGIVGRNGSGKSTLLKLIAGIYEPTKGQLTVNGKLTPFIELGVGFNMELTGRENIFLNGALLGFNRREMQAMYKDIVEFAELKKFMDQKLKNYSSGMQVRLAFSIAIRARSDILLIDEVLAVGDAAFQQKCFNYFTELKGQKRTVIFVSHDMESVMRYCENAVLIDDGKLIQKGNSSEIAATYLEQIAFSAKADEPFRTKTEKIIHSIKLTSGAKISRGDQAKLKIELHSASRLDAVVSISILRYGQYVAGISTDRKLKIELDGGKAYITLNLETGGLAKGPYNIGYSVRSEASKEFIQEGGDGPKFEIIDDEQEPNVEGVAHVEGSWGLTRSR